jgi:hypothetical protein
VFGRVLELRRQEQEVQAGLEEPLPEPAVLVVEEVFVLVEAFDWDP